MAPELFFKGQKVSRRTGKSKFVNPFQIWLVSRGQRADTTSGWGWRSRLSSASCLGFSQQHISPHTPCDQHPFGLQYQTTWLKPASTQRQLIFTPNEWVWHSDMPWSALICFSTHLSVCHHPSTYVSKMVAAPNLHVSSVTSGAQDQGPSFGLVEHSWTHLGDRCTWPTQGWSHYHPNWWIRRERGEDGGEVTQESTIHPRCARRKGKMVVWPHTSHSTNMESITFKKWRGR